jgi:uncharacterized protein (DUF1800 family)
MAIPKTDSFWIRHLLRRAGFGHTPAEFDYYKKLGYDATLDELLNPEKVDNELLETHIKEQEFDFTNIVDLKRWWLFRMAYTRRPLQEKMTLFWHGHFATSNKKVGHAYAMYLQNVLFRNYGLGNFHELLYNISKDPAMIIYLDNQQNRKGKPNENYAREIMELFTLGIGNYTEQDIKEAARAFTGWKTESTGFVFNQKQHDNGTKKVLGVSGNLNGDDVVRILVTQPATGRFLARKLIRFFVFDDPSKAYIDRIAKVYTTSDYNIRKIMHAILTSSEFLSQKAYHAHIKSPAELVVGTLKTLQIKQLDNDLPTSMARMGQNLFEPPNVKGWDGGSSWIATDTMMERFNFAARMASDRFTDLRTTTSAAELIRKQGISNPTGMVDYFLQLLVDGDVPQSTRKRLQAYVASDMKGVPGNPNILPEGKTLDAKLRGLVHLIMTLPSYQLA